MVNNITTIYQINIEEYSFLDKDDRCYHYTLYYPKDTHQRYFGKTPIEFWRIINFKKKPSEPYYHEYKPKAILEITDIICECIVKLQGILQFNNIVTESILVPVPPSQAKNDPNYDDRWVQVLKNVQTKLGIKYLDVLDRICTTLPSHENKLNAIHQFKINTYDKNIVSNQTLIIVDDVITSGCTYKAVKHHLNKEVPNNKIIGLFVAKNVRPKL